MQIRWLKGVSASCLHAAKAAAEGEKFADATLAAALAPAAAELRSEIESFKFPVDALWQHLIALSAGVDSSAELADVTLRKVRPHRSGEDADVRRLAERLTVVRTAMTGAIPSLASQLELRGGPLREQWEARGEGLLRSFARRTDEDLLVERADVVLVHPACGGGGAAHVLYNSVRIEAVLANPIPELPEVVRLAWLLAQLNMELPVFSETVNSHRLPSVAALATLPPILCAAEDVELTKYNSQTLRLAIEAWRPMNCSPHNVARVLGDWWTTFESAPPQWAVALKALDQMLGPQLQG